MASEFIMAGTTIDVYGIAYLHKSYDWRLDILQDSANLFEAKSPTGRAS